MVTSSASDRHGGLIVTGASSGIGAAIAQRLSARYAKVVGVARRPPANMWPPCVAADVADETCLERACELLEGVPLTAVVHSAGVMLDRPLIETSPRELRDLLQTNVLGAHNIVTSAIRRMAPGGVILLVSSQHARRPAVARGAYGASKAALERMISDYARECAPLGIRVLGLAPGPVWTRMTRQHFDDETRRAATAARMTLGRLVEADEVAGIAEFLLSDAAASVSGSTVLADGGYLAFP